MKIFLCLVFLLIIPVALCGEINLDYPKESNTENITFSLEIFNFSIDNYDVKIDLISNEVRVSKIWDGSWKSTMYYLNDAITLGKKEDFLINVAGFQGEAQVIIKIRDSKGKIEVFENYSITILKPDKTEDSSEINEFVEEEETKKEVITKEQTKKQLNIEKQKIPEPKYEPIILNPKTIKTEENSLEQGKGYAKYSKYSILGFCALLFFLYIIKPKKQKNEFRN